MFFVTLLLEESMLLRKARIDTGCIMLLSKINPFFSILIWTSLLTLLKRKYLKARQCLVNLCVCFGTGGDGGF